ncbi:MAG TPA: cytochrome c3 family protein [Terriglobales bacterium]|nr:cytochrome c3 family protein [Terriglobales bacterium]
MRKALYCLALVVLIASPAFSKKHPVPLDPKTDAAKCLECHEDKSKGKAVHSAIATGCTSCHEVRVNKEITRVKLTTATSHRLCLQCHADKNASEMKGKVHSPAVRDCLKCHDPHVSDNTNQLLKPASGATKNENLCLSCHNQGVNVPQGGSRHMALDMGCATCHTTHKTSDKGDREANFHLTKNSPALCVDCHDPGDETIKKAHAGQPVGGTDCLTCHDPHQSSSPKLQQKFQHAVFSGKDSCASCHDVPRDGKVVLTNADKKALCISCHEEQAKKIEGSKVQHAGAMGDCTDCHNPHASKFPGLPKSDPVSACVACHADQAEQHKKKVLHQPAFAQGCSTCHEPHGGANKKLLRKADRSGLCLECHGPEVKPEVDEAGKLVKIFDGKVRLPERYFDRVPRLALRYGLGHPVERHPAVDQVDPNDNTKVRVAINCSTCHQPHSSAEPSLLVNDQRNGMQFCGSCHKDFATR